MVAAAQGLGGPQPGEIARMLESDKRRLAEDQKWLRDSRARLDAAQKRLDQAFQALAAE
jgi:argininosuccinate lyase